MAEFVQLWAVAPALQLAEIRMVWWSLALPLTLPSAARALKGLAEVEPCAGAQVKFVDFATLVEVLVVSRVLMEPERLSVVVLVMVKVTGVESVLAISVVQLKVVSLVKTAVLSQLGLTKW